MWSRQVDTKEQAEQEVAEHRAEGHRCTDPIWINSPFKRGVRLWTYSCDAGLEAPETPAETASRIHPFNDAQRIALEQSLADR